MQIGNYISHYSMPLENRNQISSTSKSSNTEKEDFSSHFSSPDDIQTGRDSYGTVCHQAASPSIRLSEQWQRWREQLGDDPDANLPNSTGWTEENIEYLKNRYSSGELSWVEREDALNTMQKLGMISGPQSFSAHAQNRPMLNLKTEADFQELLSRCGSSTERDWNKLFADTPIASFFSIENILKWAKELPDETYDPLRGRFDMSLTEVFKAR